MSKWKLFTALLAASSTALFAQTGATATLLGTITDSTSAVVPGVTVRATNVDTQLTRTTTTDTPGTYTIFSLPIGRYDLLAQATDFRSSEVKDVAITIDQRARID